MRQGTNLNVILTINAVLLAALVWLSLGGGIFGPEEASGQVAIRAQPSNATRSAPFTGTPLVNPADQRVEMIERLEAIHSSTSRTASLLESGSAQVRVTNVAEIQGN